VAKFWLNLESIGKLSTSVTVHANGGIFTDQASQYGSAGILQRCNDVLLFPGNKPVFSWFMVGD
jgi:hypothetical protein